MIPSEEARQSRRAVRKYFELQGEPIDLFSSGDERNDLEDEDEGVGEFMEEEEEGVDILGDAGFPNHE